MVKASLGWLCSEVVAGPSGLFGWAVVGGVERFWTWCGPDRLNRFGERCVQSWCLGGSAPQSETILSLLEFVASARVVSWYAVWRLRKEGGGVRRALRSGRLRSATDG